MERKNKTLITLARAMLDDYGITKVLGKSYQHRLPCGKPGVSPQVLEEDPI